MCACVHTFHSILIYTLQEKINTANGDVTKSLQINKDKVCIHSIHMYIALNEPYVYKSLKSLVFA